MAARHIRKRCEVGRTISEPFPSLLFNGRVENVCFGPSPKPANSGCCVVDTKNWRIIKKFENIGPDCQTMSVSYDGKYVFQIYSGFQRLSSGVFVFRQDNLEKVGYMPNFGGHHDCVIIPTKLEHLRNSRCTTL